MTLPVKKIQRTPILTRNPVTQGALEVWRNSYDKIFIDELMKAQPDDRLLRSMYRFTSMGLREEKDYTCWHAQDEGHLPGIFLCVHKSRSMGTVYSPIAVFLDSDDRDVVVQIHNAFEQNYWSEIEQYYSDDGIHINHE
jgi:hypothetical protein